MKYTFIERFDTCYLIMFSVILFIYLSFIGIIHPSIFSVSQYPYYNYLLDSFFQGRLDFDKPLQTQDLSYYQGKWYIFWGASALLYILPFFIFAGKHTSDVLYTLVAGLINVVLFFVLVREFIHLIKLQATRFHIVCAVVSFALASPNFYLSQAAGIWHTSQIIGVMYVLVSYIFLIRFLKHPKLWHFIISVFFFNLAWSTRHLLILNGVVFGAIFYLIYKKKVQISFRKVLLWFSFITVAFVSVVGLYNYLRFGSVLDTGLAHQVGNIGTSFSVANIPHSLETYFLLKTYDSSNAEGFSRIYKTTNVFILYPFIFAMLWGTRFISSFKKHKIFLGSLVTVVIINTVVLLFFQMAGPRFFLDISPQIFLIGIIGIVHMSKKVAILITIFGVMINIVALTHYIGLF